MAMKSAEPTRSATSGYKRLPNVRGLNELDEWTRASAGLLPSDRARALPNEQDRERGRAMSDICLVCGEDYPPNGIVMCDDCGMDKDIEQQQEREGNK
jgi:hypothetical protein